MAINTFLTSPGDTFTVASNSVNVFGSVGSQTVLVNSGVTATKLDANIERVDLSGAASTYKFVTVAGTGLEIQTSAGVVVGTLGSLNQNALLAFSDGSAALVQTATTFTIGGTAVATGTTTASAAVTPATFDTTVKSAVVATVTTPAALTITTSAASATESTVTTNTADFTVTLSAVQTAAVTVNYATSDGTGASGALASSDYTTTNGTVTIAVGATTGKISIPIIDNTVFDGTASNTSGVETFTLTLSGASTGTLSNSTATGTITDNEANSLPVNTVPSALNVGLSATTAIPGISVADANDATMTTVVTATNGLLSAPVGGALATAVSGAASITLSGSVTNVNTSLAAMTYVSSRTVAGVDSLSVKSTDPLGGSTTTAVTINVNAGGVFTNGVTNTFVGTSANEFYTGVGTDAAAATDRTWEPGVDSVAASTGTDTLTLTQVVVADLAPTVASSGLEVLTITSGTTSTTLALAIDATKFGTLTNINFTDGNATVAGNRDSLAVSNAPSGLTTTVNTSLIAAGLQVVAATAGATENVVLAGGVTVPLLNGTAASLTTTLNITSSGSSANTITNLGAANPAVTAAGTVNILGSAALSVTTSATAASGVSVINGSTATGALTINNAASTVAATITGGTGNDTITGSSTTVANTLNGGAGNDTITGGALADTITGGAGDDTINGGAGAADTSITPGAGKDTVTINQTGDTVILVAGDTGTIAASTADVITGIIEGVKINVSGYDSSTFSTTFIANGNLATATAGASSTLRDIYINSTNKSIVIEMDATGTTTQEISIGVASSATIANVGGVLTFGAVPLTSYVSGSTILVEGQSPSLVNFINADLSSTLPQVGMATGRTAGTGVATGATLSNVTGATSSFANIDLSKTVGAAGTVITGSAVSNTIVGTSMSDFITAGLGGDTVNVGAGTDTLYVASDATGAGTATAGSLTAAGVIGAATLSFATTGMDIVTGFGSAGDMVQLFTTVTTAITTSTTLLTGASTWGAATVGDVAIVRGGYASGVFTASTTGADSALIWDSNGTGAAGTYNAIILVGFVDSGANDTISAAGLYTVV